MKAYFCLSISPFPFYCLINKKEFISSKICPPVSQTFSSPIRCWVCMCLLSFVEYMECFFVFCFVFGKYFFSAFFNLVKWTKVFSSFFKKRNVMLLTQKRDPSQMMFQNNSDRFQLPKASLGKHKRWKVILITL